MRLPLDVVKLITAYVPSKQLLSWIEAYLHGLPARECHQYFWGNPNVFASGIFHESELPTAPMHLIAGNPACANYIMAHWDMFQKFNAVWQNAGLWEWLKTQEEIKSNVPSKVRSHVLSYLTKNPHPEAILFLQQNGIEPDATNPAFVFTKMDFRFCNGTISEPLVPKTWANPSAVPFLKQIVANQGKANYAWLRENPHPWAIRELCKSNDISTFSGSQFQELFQNEGIFETVDLRELQFLLSQIGV